MSKDTIYSQYTHGNYNIAFHLTDSGAYLILKKDTLVIFNSGYSDAYYMDTLICTDIPNYGFILLIPEAYCDGTDYDLLVVKNDSAFIKSIAQTYAGDLCDTEPSIQPIYIIDNNSDGFPEYYINYSFKNKKPKQLPYSFYFDSKTLLVK